MKKDVITGNVNQPNYRSVAYEGLTTETASVSVNNDPKNRSISVDVDVDAISFGLAKQKDLDKETNERTEQFETLSNALNNEQTDRRTGDYNLSQQISFEANRAQTEEARLDTKIEDLDNSLATVAKTGDYADLNNKPDLSDMATETWVGEQGFLTSSDISNMVTTDTDQEITGEKTFFYSNDWVYQNYATVRGDKIELSRFNSGERTSKSSLTAEALNIEGLYADLNLETNASKFNIHVDAGDGGSVPVEFRLSDINDNSYTLDLPYKNGTLSTIEDFETLTPSNQAHSVVVYDALHNISGKNLSAYSAVETTLGVYPVIIIKTSSSEILTEAQAKSYMAAQTGSRFLPIYDYDNPTYSYLIFADGSLYKPQYDSTNGLVLYKMSNPYASKVDLTNYVTLASDQTITGIKSFENSGANLEVSGSRIYWEGSTADEGNFGDYGIFAETAANLPSHMPKIGIGNLSDPTQSLFGFDSMHSISYYQEGDPGENPTIYTYTFPEKDGTIATTDECGTKLYKHTLRFSKEVGPDEYQDMDIDIVSIRGTAYPDLSTISNDKNYEVLSYGYIQPEDMPKQVIGFEDSGMDSFIIYYLSGDQIKTIEVSDFVSDTVTPL